MGYVLIALNIIGCLSVPVQAIVKNKKEKTINLYHGKTKSKHRNG